MTEPAPRTSIVPHDTRLPPPRPGVRYVRVRWLGIVISDDDLRRRIDNLFYRPMIVLALIVLPLFVFETFFLKADSAFKGTWIDWAMLAAIIVIWLAFFIEFAVKIAIAECRIEYVRRNWLDIIILLAPMLRVVRAARIARTTKVFTLRGVGMKFARYAITLIIGMEATDRVMQRLGLKSRRGRKDPEEMTRGALTDEVKELRKLTDAWEGWYEAHEQYLELHGRPDGAFTLVVPVEKQLPGSELVIVVVDEVEVDAAPLDANGVDTPPPPH